MNVPKRFKSSDVQILMRQQYEKAYGIYDHSMPDDYFALVRHHWAEDSISASRARERLEAFIELEAGKKLHMSFTEFIEQPTWMCDMQLQLLEKRIPGETKELQDAIEDLKRGPGKK